MTTIPLSALTATWNASGTTFTGIKLNVQDTASAAGSLLLDLQVGAVSQFKVGKGGVVSVGSTLELGHASDTTLARASAGVVTIEGNTVYTSGNLPGTSITWTAAQTFGASGNKLKSDQSAFLYSTAADTLRWIVGIRNDITGNTEDYIFYNSSLASTACTIDLTNDEFLFRVAPKVSTNIVFHAGNLPGTAITWTANQTLSDVNIVLGTTTGTKIGTATNQKLAFFNATPVVQPTAVADATDAASVITQLNALLTRMRNLGLIAT
jgi:hypothetical protein